jgi:cytochrome c oxidase cbb3-type subunit 2
MSKTLNRVMWMSLSLSQPFLRLVFLSLACALPALAQGAHVGHLIGHADAGKKNYQRWCIGCHGPFGDGNGENAPWIDPKPRDFTAATFKCRSTPTGTLPTDDDLYNSVARGFTNSNMPHWDALSKQTRIDLVAYVKTFSDRWKTDKPGDVLKIPAETPITIQSIAHNFAAGADDSRFKCGSTNQDIYKIFMTGVDGTPMPSFNDVIQPNDAWDLVHYLRTLQINRHSKENEVLRAAGGKIPKLETPATPPASQPTPQPDAKPQGGRE